LLRNVTEEFTRQSKPRETSEGESQTQSEVPVQTRRVKQLLIKGDSVVLISRVNGNQ
jgi:small nuclear ribonucleoprotein (snRNP)-like protein